MGRSWALHMYEQGVTPGLCGLADSCSLKQPRYHSSVDKEGFCQIMKDPRSFDQVSSKSCGNSIPQKPSTGKGRIPKRQKAYTSAASMHG